LDIVWCKILKYCILIFIHNITESVNKTILIHKNNHLNILQELKSTIVNKILPNEKRIYEFAFSFDGMFLFYIFGNPNR